MRIRIFDEMLLGRGAVLKRGQGISLVKLNTS